MVQAETGQPVNELLDKILGYLNFSSGQYDLNFFKNVDAVFRYLHADLDSPQNGNGPNTPESASVESGNPNDACPNHQLKHRSPVAKAFEAMLRDRLEQVKTTSTAFQDSVQVETILSLFFDDFVPAFLLHHQDLLFHQNQDFLFNSFFFARSMATVVEKSNTSDSHNEIIRLTLARLNDFLGHRPVASLTSRKIEPYENEWVCPLPVYLKGVGVAVGHYEPLVSLAIEILHQTDEDILRDAQFSPHLFEELAIDPRAFDFDHPVNKRPNHHFGAWDEHQVGKDGHFHRFIVHQATLDSLMHRVEQCRSEDPELSDEFLFEAAAALAGTMLMGSGITGDRPGAHDSTVTLGSLLPNIARYRDEFYRSLIKKIPAPHRQRLEDEAQSRKQVFGAVRQHLNAQLSQRRAYQLVNCRLASIFARMGYPDAADHQSKLVPVASARIICQIDCLLSEANRSIKEENLSQALEKIPQINALLQRGIQCGAIVDPWNILGFDGNYSLFPALENSVRDHRVFELVDLVECIMALCSRLWSEAAAVDDEETCQQIREEFNSFVQWWRKYAAHEVMAVSAVDAIEIFQAAELVSQALRLWHIGGAAAGDISFWAEHAELFDSPKAYTLVIDALIQRKDYKTAMALLIHWLGQATEIGLQQGDSSFHNLAFRWIADQKRLLLSINSPDAADHSASSETPILSESAEDIWQRIVKFYDFTEANADLYWEVPDFDISRKISRPDRDEDFLTEVEQLPGDEDGEEHGDRSLYSAAYDDVTFNDSANDGNEGQIFENNFGSDEALEAEVDRVLDRLEFLGTVASYWRIAATIPLPADREHGPQKIEDAIKLRLENRLAASRSWLDQATRNYRCLIKLCDEINQYEIPQLGTDQDSMMQYDQNRLYKESLMDQAIITSVETENAMRSLEAVIRAIEILLAPANATTSEILEYEEDELEKSLTETYAGILLKDTERILRSFDALVDYFSGLTTLYVPLAKKGSPVAIVTAQVTKTAMLDLLRSLPALGLLVPTYELTRTAFEMERNQPPINGAVTEYDEIFEVAFTSMVESVSKSTTLYQSYLRESGRPESEVVEQSESVLFDCINMLTESMLVLWLRHSQTLRLSVLERVHKPSRWDETVKFIRQYGGELFTQNFLHMGNIRGILHRGVEDWIEEVQQSHDLPDWDLFRALETGQVSVNTAVKQLTLVLEAVRENFNEYRDYNTTTTQSDNGEMLYMFLDFLVLRSRYDRICWNLNPVVWAHRILVRRQRSNVARMWRRSLKSRVGAEAERYVGLLDKLRDKYSMQMASVGRRIEGRFTSEMQIDRLIALVKPAMNDQDSEQAEKAFSLLVQEAQAFSKSTIGVGIDLPPWLAALEHEVQQRLLPVRLRTLQTSQHWGQSLTLPIANLREQLEELPSRTPEAE